jgi:hypothetical protein
MEKGSIGEYDKLLESYTGTEEFSSMADDRAKGDALINFRETYRKSRELDDETNKQLDNFTNIQADYIKKSRFAPTVDDLVGLGVPMPDVSAMPDDQALRALDTAKEQMQAGVSATFDPVYVQDFNFGLDALFQEEERAVRGRSTGKVADLGYRAMQGATNRFLTSLGLSEKAAEVSASYFPENPEFDTDFSSDLATGAGDMLVTLGAAATAAALSGGNLYAAGATGFYINSVGKYEENYKKVMQETGNELAAHDAGLASLPGAALESMGEVFQVGMLKKAAGPIFNKAYTEAATSAAKQEVVRTFLKDASFTKRVGRGVLLGGLQEGLSESAGSLLSGLGGSAVTGLDLTPTGDELLREGAVGSVLGGGVAGVTTGVEVYASGLGPKLAKAQAALASGDQAALDEAVNGLKPQEEQLTNKSPEASATLETPVTPVTPDLTPTTTEISDDGATVFKAPTGVALDANQAKLHDFLLNNLIAQQPLDDVDTLPAGQTKGARNSPPANKTRKLANVTSQALDEEIETLLPQRAKLYSEVDKVGLAAKVPQVDLDLYKRTVDAVALTALQHGVPLEQVYGNATFEVGAVKTMADRDFKTIDYKFGRLAELEPTLGREEAIKEAFGEIDNFEELQRSYVDEKDIRELVSSYTPAALNQAKLTQARDHFEPQLLEAYAKGPGFKSRETLVEMPIDDFLKLAAPIRDDQATYSNLRDGVVPSGDHAQALREIIEGGTKLDELPFLSVNEQDGRVSGHEGRHRAKALKALGYDTMPVVWKSGRIRWSEQSDPSKFDYVEDWPTELMAEDGVTSIPYPVNREGKYEQLTNKSPDETLNQYAGRRANLDPVQEQNRDAAYQMLKSGRTPEEIKLATGWFPGKYDGKLRWEISDDASSDVFTNERFEELLDQGVTKALSADHLEKLLTHPSLYEAYPDIRKVLVLSYPMDGNTLGAFYEKENQIVIDSYNENALGTLIHEIQHWIQAKEGFARGGNSSDIKSFVSDESINSTKKEAESFRNLKSQQLNETILFYENYESAIIPSIDQDKFSELVSSLNKLNKELIFSDGPINQIDKQSRELNQQLRDLLQINSDEINLLHDEVFESALNSNSLGTFEDFKRRISNRRTARKTSLYKLNELYQDLSNPNTLEGFIKEFKLGHNMYRLLAGEIEARDTAARMDFNPQQRERIEPYSSENIPAEQAILRFKPIRDTANEQLANKSQVKGNISFGQAPLSTTIKDFDPSLQAVIKIMRNGGDISTFHHETFHYWHRSGLIAKLLTPAQLTAFEQAAKVKDGVWDKDNYELAARTYEAWLRNPKVGKTIKVPTILDKAFQRISASMRKLYQSLRESGLPYQDVKGTARPAIHPAFRTAFEAMYNFQPQLISESSKVATQQDQNGQQLAVVNEQLTQRSGVVSPPTTDPSLTTAQLNEQDDSVYVYDANDNFNIKAIAKVKNRGSKQEADAIKLFQDTISFNAGLVLNKDEAGLFYGMLDNYVKSRKLVREDDRQLLTIAPKIKDEDNYEEIRRAGEPAYLGQLINELTKIKANAAQRWNQQYRDKNAQYLKDAPEDLTREELQKIVRDAKRQDPEEGNSERRQSLEDNILLLQANLKTRDLTSLKAELKTPDALDTEMDGFLEFLSSVDATSQELTDPELLELEIVLDAMLNNGTPLGLKQYAKHGAKAWFGQVSNKAKYRDPYAKFGLVGLFNNVTSGASSKLMTRLSLTSTNLERLAGNDAAKDNIISMTANYMSKVGDMQIKANEWSKFMMDTREKWWPRMSVGRHDMHLAGMISKVMQAPEDATQEVRDEFVRNSAQQMLKGINYAIARGGHQAVNATKQLELFNEIMAGLPEDFSQADFIKSAEARYPKHMGYINDMVGWLETNLKSDARFILEALYERPFRSFMHYLPTRQVPLDDARYNPDDLNLESSAIDNNYGDGGFFVANVITTDSADALKERQGYVKKDFMFATNLENTLDRGVKALLSDVYTGLERQKLSYLLNSNSSLRAELENHLGGGIRVSHLLQTIRDMVSTDLNEHAQINGVEMMVNRAKRNIVAPLLGSVHQLVTQPFSQFVAHSARRPEVFKEYGEAMKLITMVDKDSPMGQAWARLKEANLSARALPHDAVLTKGKNLRANEWEGLSKSILDKMGLSMGQVDQFKNIAAHWDDKIKQQFILGPLRVGDLFSADLIFAAELIHAARVAQTPKLDANGKQANIKLDLEQLDLDKISPLDIAKATGVMDEAINASRNSRRGYNLAHPSAIINLLTAFSGHRIAMATNLGLKLRNIADLSISRDFSDPMFRDSVRTAVATVAQSIAFTLLKAAVVGSIARGMYLAMTPDDDEDRFDVYGPTERKQVEELRKLTDETLHRSFSPEAVKKAVFRDAFGSIHWAFSFAGLDNTIMLGIDDFAKPTFEEEKEGMVEQLKKSMRENFDTLTPEQLQDLRNQIKVVESTKYLPLGFKNFGESDLSGGFGLVVQPLLDLKNSVNDLVVEDKAFSVEELLLLGRLFGFGQPEITRYLKMKAKQDDIQAKYEEEASAVDFGF